MQIRITLSLNADAFLLLTEKAGYSIDIESCYLRVSYIELHEIEKRIQIQPIPYFVSKPEIIIKPITSTGRIIRIHEIFHQKLPSHAFFCLQKVKTLRVVSEQTHLHSFLFKSFSSLLMEALILRII